ncbi:MAG: hypothetical protein ACE15F_20385 [bacterium]
MNQKCAAVYLFAGALVFGAMAMTGWAQDGGGQPGGAGTDIALQHLEGAPGGGGLGEAPRMDPPAAGPRDPAGPGPRFGGGFGRGGGRGLRAQGDQPPFGRGRDQGPVNRESQPPYEPGFRGGEKTEAGVAKCPCCENCPYCQRAREGCGGGQPGIQGERQRPLGMMRRLRERNPEVAQKWMDEMKAGVPPRPAFRRALEEAGPDGPFENERPAFERFRRFLRERPGFESRRPEARERFERESAEREREDRQPGNPERAAAREIRKHVPEREDAPAHSGELDGQIESLNQRLNALEEKFEVLMEKLPKWDSVPREVQEHEDKDSE